MSWAARRRLIYGGIFVLVLALISFGIFWKVFYNAPTCNDGIKNGEEKGVDCGGACKNLCTSDTLSPIVLWTKVFNISGEVYSAVSYVENPNINSKNLNARYEFKIYDENNKLLLIKEGVTSVPKGKKFAIFENGLVLKGTKAKSAELSFISFGPWQRDTSIDPQLDIKNSSLLSTSSVPRVTGTITNETTENVPEIELAVFVLDGNENVVAASQSFINDLTKKSSQDFVFTWPKPFNLGVEACIAPLDLIVALDKSGSMRSEGLFPPEPFTTVTKTANSFIKNLTLEDQVSVISFGNASKIENTLSKDKKVGEAAINNLFLSTTTQEQTNIAAGLTDALTELNSERGRVDGKKVIVLLTDGLPTLPLDANIVDFPVLAAQQIASTIKASGIDIYTIGLGKNVSEGFLKSISTSDNHYFLAPTKETLTGIYAKIASNLCQKKPNVVNVIYKIPN